MKKAILIFAFITLPFIAIAQNEVAVSSVINTEINVIEKIAEKTEAKKETTSNSEIKNQIIYINHKKSAEIISIKAYRKSLSIKVKTVKLC